MAVWLIFTLHTFFDSDVIIFSFSCVGCFITFLILIYAAITTTKPDNYIKKRPLVPVVMSAVNVFISVLIVVLAYARPPMWELGGIETHTRVGIM